MQKSYTIKGPRGESSPGPPSHFCAWGGVGGGGGGFDLINQTLGFDLGRKKHLLSQEELQLATLAFVTIAVWFQGHLKDRKSVEICSEIPFSNSSAAPAWPFFTAKCKGLVFVRSSTDGQFAGLTQPFGSNPWKQEATLWSGENMESP